MRCHALLGRAFSFLLAAGLGFGAMALVGFDGSRPPVGAAEPGSQELHDVLGGSRAGKLVAFGDERAELDRSDAIQVRVENRFGRRARIVYAVELVDEFGEQVQRPTTSRTRALRADETAEIDLRVPPRLADGFYLFRVTAVGRSGRETADSGVEVGFIVSGNSTRLLGDEEWLQLSYANEGVEQ